MDWFRKLFPPVLRRKAQPLAPVYLKPGKWVMYQGQIAIVSWIPSSDTITLDLVDPFGETSGQIQAPIGLCRLANWLEIPESRRPSHETAVLRGYHGT